MPRPVATNTTLPALNFFDVLKFAGEVTLPTIALGVIIRRQAMVNFAERHDLPRRAVRRMQRLRAKYGEGPLLVRTPMRTQALVLARQDVLRVLNGTPKPFSPASSEKKAALSHFEPRVALISEGAERSVRRQINEDALDTGPRVHRCAGALLQVVREEMAPLRDQQRIAWADFAPAWFRLVRRVSLGDGARDDETLTAMIDRLRRSANWAFLVPKRRKLRARFLARLESHIARAPSWSLAGGAKAGPQEMKHQTPQWLFAFDPAGMTTFRALALLAAHSEHQARAHDELAQGPDESDLTFLRACVLEALRLWPTTPAILRQTHEETHWRNGRLPAKAGLLIFAPFLHRDDQSLDYADRFAPDIWLHRNPEEEAALVPFSGGPAICPARHLVPMLASVALATLLRGRDVSLVRPASLLRDGKLLSMLSPYTLQLEFAPRALLRRNMT